MPPIPPPSSTATRADDPSDDSVVAEHIPWHQLTVEPPPDRSRWVYLFAAAVALVAVGVVAFQYLRRPAVTPLAVLPATTTLTTQAAAAVALPPPPAPEPISEADLLAVDGVAIERRLSASAEWIVLEFYSFDPGDDWGERVAAAAGATFTEVPEGPNAGSVSYMEWVRTLSVDDVATGRYRAVVLLRRLVSEDGVSYRRLPVERATVELRLSDDGQVQLAAPPTLDAVTGGRLPVELDVGSGASGEGGFVWPAP